MKVVELVGKLGQAGLVEWLQKLVVLIKFFPIVPVEGEDFMVQLRPYMFL
jgi:hypothetical protein